MAQHDAAGADVTGRAALVTGAGRGLGRAFAERLAVTGADIAMHAGPQCRCATPTQSL
jgi:3-oxoacyl-[acyl-carrier protein] reductase